MFKYPTSQQEIEDAIGVRSNNSLDLISGIIFVKDKKVVYEEVFTHDFESTPRFFIYINFDSSNRQNLKVFAPGDIFTCTIVNYRDTDGYSLKPKEHPSSSSEKLHQDLY